MILRDRLTVPCPDCHAEAEPINIIEDGMQCSCPSCGGRFVLGDMLVRRIIKLTRSNTTWLH